jgi:hypothetical protein
VFWYLVFANREVTLGDLQQPLDSRLRQYYPYLPDEDEANSFMPRYALKYDFMKELTKGRRALVSCCSTTVPQFFSHHYLEYLVERFDAHIYAIGIDYIYFKISMPLFLETVVLQRYEKLFESFMETNTRLRIQGTKDGNKSVEQLAKIIGNSSYGISLLKSDKFCNTKLVKGELKYTKLLSSPFFADAIELPKTEDQQLECDIDAESEDDHTEKYYEVQSVQESSKKKCMLVS